MDGPWRRQHGIPPGNSGRGPDPAFRVRRHGGDHKRKALRVANDASSKSDKSTPEPEYSACALDNSLPAKLPAETDCARDSGARPMMPKRSTPLSPRRPRSPGVLIGPELSRTRRALSLDRKAEARIDSTPRSSGLPWPNQIFCAVGSDLHKRFPPEELEAQLAHPTLGVLRPDLIGEGGQAYLSAKQSKRALHW